MDLFGVKLSLKEEDEEQLGAGVGRKCLMKEE